MAKNKLVDLNNHLFAQLERLSEEDITPEELAKEIERSKAINGVAKNIIDNAKTTLEGAEFAMNRLPSNKRLPEQFEPKEE
ncbi:hypothetical protein LCGC14_1042720 [marine sediment metagenome]|uniref:Phage protein n=2 Tax=root TaxID=1 RepID=A0A831QNM6_9FLAO|nr:hypothetical protein [Pricia antarctica]